MAAAPESPDKAADLALERRIGLT
ncbi:hypothetical protein NB311A_01519 [Nitrobacter sp. Nb-311A]|nr:hypothetical protein NB311A_01519 [Nitrobacter sp. Nb-311A]